MEIEGILYETATMGLDWKVSGKCPAPRWKRGLMKRENELGIMVKCRKLIEYIFIITEVCTILFLHGRDRKSHMEAAHRKQKEMEAETEKMKPQ